MFSIPEKYNSKSKNNNINNNTNYVSNKTVLLTTSLIGLFTMLLIAFSFTIPFSGADSPYCKGVYMNPAYAKIRAFDSSYTRFASKYSLYLYREQGKDKMPGKNENFNLTGTPVLFIPGNAGSYKQVRSIAAETADQYFYNINNIKLLNPNTNNLDFFTADFNEDFTAFHGRTMLDQSEYLNEAVKFILSLYKSNDNSNDNYPTSVIILSHSMGGIVARVMLSLPNYLEDSINTIITLSTPHNAAPTTFETDLLNVFKLTDEFWMKGFAYENDDDEIENIDMNIHNKISKKHNKHNKHNKILKLNKIARKRLSNVSLISITGGMLDTTLPTDYTTLTGLVPSNHGFSVSTTGIPEVWTPIDHLAIVWCDQLRKVLSKTLLSIVDKNSKSQTYPLNKRMEIFKSILLPNLTKSSNIISDTQLGLNIPYKLKIDLKQLKDSTNQRFFQLPKNHIKRDLNSFPPINLFNIPKDDNYKFNFISSLKPTSIEDLDDSTSTSILLCRSVLNEDIRDKNYYKKIYDYTTDDTMKFAELECIDINKYTYIIPLSYTDNKVYYSLELPSNILNSFNNVIMIESEDVSDIMSDDDFVLADLQLESLSKLKAGDSSLWKLISQGNDITIPVHRPIIIDIDIPSIRSSLLAYRLDIRYKKSINEKFSPIISQSVKGEVKWHIDIDSNKHITSMVNSNSPYTPFIVNDLNSSSKFKIFTDSLSSDEIMDIYVTVDWFKSLSLLVVKYRLSIIGFPLFFTLLIILCQFIQYTKYNKYPSYGETMLYICSLKTITILSIIFSLLSFLTSTKLSFGKFIEIFNPLEINHLDLMSNIEKSKVEVNNIFMGIEEISLWFYGTFILYISIGLNFLLYNLILLVLILLLQLSKLSIWKSVKLPKFKNFSKQRKTISVISLILLVLIYLPYQFAFIVCVLTQVFSTLNSFIANPNLNAYSTSVFKNYTHSKEKSSDSNSNSDDDINEDKVITKEKLLILTENFKNFKFSLMMLMFWLVAIHVPVLIVWIHDISIRWITPFSSHHNILAILPIVILIQLLNQGYMIPRPKTEFNIIVTQLVLLYFMIYSLLFGTRHLYFLHNLFNLLCVWFIILIVQDWSIGGMDKANLISKNISKIS